MRVNLLKRMESSINSFALTTERLLGQVQGILEKIAAHDDGDLEELSIEGLDLDDEKVEPFLIGSKIKVLVRDVDRIRWKQELEEDALLLEEAAQ